MTLDEKKGERAMLVKNKDGDHVIVKGSWEGFKKGKPPPGGIVIKYNYYIICLNYNIHSIIRYNSSGLYKNMVY